MKKTALLVFALTGLSVCLPLAKARDVVAFWSFANSYDFPSNTNKQDFAPEVDNSLAGNASLQAYLGVADNLDNNGGSGFATYTSPTSGVFYDYH